MFGFSGFLYFKICRFLTIFVINFKIKYYSHGVGIKVRVEVRVGVGDEVEDGVRLGSPHKNIEYNLGVFSRSGGEGSNFPGHDRRARSNLLLDPLVPTSLPLA